MGGPAGRDLQEEQELSSIQRPGVGGRVRGNRGVGVGSGGGAGWLLEPLTAAEGHLAGGMSRGEGYWEGSRRAGGLGLGAMGRGSLVSSVARQAPAQACAHTQMPAEGTLRF